jgi:hypothetical protein
VKGERVEEQRQQLDGYAVVEVVGRQTFAGKISEHVIGGAALLRIDIPEVPEKQVPYQAYDEKYQPIVKHRTLHGQPSFTKFIGINSIYALTPCTEEVAQRVAEEARKYPISGTALRWSWRTCSSSAN